MAALALLVNAAVAAHAQPFQGDIDRWVAQDAQDAPDPGSVLFVGSSSIRRWEQLAQDFADYPVLQRGFGGSRLEHLVGFVDDIVLPYQPSAIVVWSGTNDIAAGEPAEEVIADYRAFVAAVHAAQPGVEIFYLGIMPTPGRFANGPIESRVNTAIASLSAEHAKLHYIDLPAAFQALNPPSDPAFNSMFVDDIHLSRDGYRLWTRIVRPALEAVVAPNKVFVPNPRSPGPGGTILLDLGPSNPQDGDPTPSPDARGNHWNNWHAAQGEVAVNAGEHLSNLVDTTGAHTGIRLTITGGFLTNGKLNGGLLSPDPGLLGDLAVGAATQDYFFLTADGVPRGGSDDVPGGFMLDGLDPQLTYDFTFFGSRQTTAPRVTEYRVTGGNSGVARLQTSGSEIGNDGTYDGNDDRVARVSGIRPDAYGRVFIDLTVIRGGFAYLNAMRITVVPEPASASLLFTGAALLAPRRRAG